MYRIIAALTLFVFIGCTQKEPSIFEKYKIEFNRPNTKHQLIYNPELFESYEQFKYWVEEFQGYYLNNENEIFFAGYYKVILDGCGTGCIYGYMIDIRDGKMYSLPMGYRSTLSLTLPKIILENKERNPYTKQENESDDLRYKFKEDSRLFLTASEYNEFKDESKNCYLESRQSGCFDEDTTNIYFHLWDEKEKKFDTFQKITLYPTKEEIVKSEEIF